MKLSTTVIILKKNTYMMLVTNTENNFHMKYSNTLMPMMLRSCVYQLEGFNALTKCKEHQSENLGAAHYGFNYETVMETLMNNYGVAQFQLSTLGFGKTTSQWLVKY